MQKIATFQHRSPGMLPIVALFVGCCLPSIATSEVPHAMDACLPGTFLFFFKPDSAILKGISIESFRDARNNKLLDGIVTVWRRAGGTIAITGHEDGMEATHDTTLGLQRAEAVGTALSGLGIRENLISKMDKGVSAPLYPQPAGVAEEQNRFAEVRLEKAVETCVTGLAK